jgi:WD40 repeat protein
MMVTHDNRCLVTGSSDKSIKIWSVDDKKLLFEIKNAHEESVRVLLLDNRNRNLISGSDDRCIKVWETTNWSNRYTINGAHLSILLLNC